MSPCWLLRCWESGPLSRRPGKSSGAGTCTLQRCAIRCDNQQPAILPAPEGLPQPSLPARRQSSLGPAQLLIVGTWQESVPSPSSSALALASGRMFERDTQPAFLAAVTLLLPLPLRFAARQ